MGWRIDYIRLYKRDFEKRYPQSAKDHGIPAPMIPSDKKANGLTALIIRWLTYHGHYANRISTQGQARVQKVPRFDIHSEKLRYSEKTSWTKGHTKKGTPDITGIIYGNAVWIEVKVGKDKMSEAQIEQKGSIEGSGGLYFIAHDMQSFVDWYYTIVEDPDKYTTPDGYE